MTTSAEKWPVKITVIKVSSNSINQEMDFFFISGLMNKEQAATLEEKLTILAKFPVDTENIVVSTLVSRQQLVEVLAVCQKLSKSWRGQYQVVMKEFTAKSEEALKS